MKPIPPEEMKKLRAAEILSEETKEKLKKFKRVFVQFPEGLKSRMQEIKRELEELGLEVIFDLEPTYGYCDLKDDEALRLGCDVILHIGHNSFGFENLKPKIPVIVQEYYYELNKELVDMVLERDIDKIKEFKKIGIVGALQYKNYIFYLKEKLKELGFEVFIPRNFQILGCNYINAKEIEEKVDCFLVPTHGYFYPLGLALETEKKVFSFDLERGIEDMEKYKKRYLKKLFWNLNKFKESKKVGLIVSWKPGQIFYDPFRVCKAMVREGKGCSIFALEDMTEEKLGDLDVDIFVNLSCPRISEYNFEIPIINFKDLLKYDKEVIKIWNQLPETSSSIRPSRDHH